MDTTNTYEMDGYKITEKSNSQEISCTYVAINKKWSRRIVIHPPQIGFISNYIEICIYVPGFSQLISDNVYDFCNLQINLKDYNCDISFDKNQYWLSSKNLLLKNIMDVLKMFEDSQYKCIIHIDMNTLHNINNQIIGLDQKEINSVMRFIACLFLMDLDSKHAINYLKCSQFNIIIVPLTQEQQKTLLNKLLVIFPDLQKNIKNAACTLDNYDEWRKFAKLDEWEKLASNTNMKNNNQSSENMHLAKSHTRQILFLVGIVIVLIFIFTIGWQFLGKSSNKTETIDSANEVSTINSGVTRPDLINDETIN